MNPNAIDMHSHFFPREWEDLGRRFGTPDWPWMKHLGGDRAMVMLGEREFRPVYSACWDAGRRLEEMDRDMAALSASARRKLLVDNAKRFLGL